MEYIRRSQQGEGCVFCELLADARGDAERLILLRAPESFLVLNAYPYTPGHLLAVPYRHVPNLGGLPPAALDELLRLTQLGERAVRRAFGCRSLHMGANLGRAAGAGVPGHVHLHVVAWPEDGLWQRWEAAATPPEALEATCRELREILAALGAGADPA
jgi:ATP adenylyltransferase